MIIPDLQHAQEALGRLLEQYKNQPNYAGLVNAISGEIQCAENALIGMITDEVLDSATGAQLDGYGKIVGQPRNGMADDQYRLYIKVRKLVDRSSGTGPEILAIFDLLNQAIGAAMVFTEYFPAAFVLKLNQVAWPLPYDSASILQQAKAGGVNAQMAWQGVPDAQCFYFAGGPGLGFDTLSNPGSGGSFAEVTE